MLASSTRAKTIPPPPGAGRGSRRLALMVCLATAVIATAACSQPVAVPLPEGADLNQPVSLADCVRIALSVNPSVAIAEQSVRQARAGLTQARSAQLPDLSLQGALGVTRSAGGARSSTIPSPTGGAATTVTQSNTNTIRTAQAVLSQTLFQSGLHEQIGAARASAKASGYGLDDARRTVVLNVAQSYYAALAARALGEVALRAVKASLDHIEAANARITHETAAPADLYPFQVELAQARLQAITAENTVKTSLTALKQAIGLPPGVSLQLSELLARPELPGEFDDLLQQAYRERPDILQQQAQVQAARLTWRAAQIQRGPVLDASGSVSYGTSYGTTGTGGQVQLGVTMPVFDGGFTRAKAESARAALDTALESLQQLQLGIGAEVERNYLNVLEANSRIDAAETAVRAAQVSLDAAEGKYEAGVGGVIDVTDAELRLRQSETDRVQAYYDYNSALAALRAAVGQPAAPGADQAATPGGKP